MRQILRKTMTKLSVNINKVATLRNARGGDTPNVVKVALDCEAFGADGITVHPRPDERHIRRADVYDLRPLLRTEFNIEGYPSPEFIDLVLKVKPHQVTLVPDDPSQITSNSGWDTKQIWNFCRKFSISSTARASVLPSLLPPTRRWWNMRQKQVPTVWNFIRNPMLRHIRRIRKRLLPHLWKQPKQPASWASA